MSRKINRKKKIGSSEANKLENLNYELRNKCNKIEIESSIQGAESITEVIVLGNQILEIIEKKTSIIESSDQTLINKIMITKSRKIRKINKTRKNVMLLLSAANVIAAEYSI